MCGILFHFNRSLCELGRVVVCVIPLYRKHMTHMKCMIQARVTFR